MCRSARVDSAVRACVELAGSSGWTRADDVAEARVQHLWLRLREAERDVLDGTTIADLVVQQR